SRRRMRRGGRAPTSLAEPPAGGGEREEDRQRRRDDQVEVARQRAQPRGGQAGREQPRRDAGAAERGDERPDDPDAEQRAHATPLGLLSRLYARRAPSGPEAYHTRVTVYDVHPSGGASGSSRGNATPARFDLVILGSGSTAFGAALKAAELGAT